MVCDKCMECPTPVPQGIVLEMHLQNIDILRRGLGRTAAPFAANSEFVPTDIVRIRHPLSVESNITAGISWKNLPDYVAPPLGVRHCPMDSVDIEVRVRHRQETGRYQSNV
jgi:hypothetical protein